MVSLYSLSQIASPGSSGCFNFLKRIRLTDLSVRRGSSHSCACFSVEVLIQKIKKGSQGSCGAANEARESCEAAEGRPLERSVTLKVRGAKWRCEVSKRHYGGIGNSGENLTYAFSN
jgi:hypothetical protein